MQQVSIIKGKAEIKPMYDLPPNVVLTTYSIELINAVNI